MAHEQGVLDGGGNHVGVRRAYRHPLLRALHGALLEEAEVEIERKLRVAVLVAAGHHKIEIADSLGVSLAEVQATVRQLERVAPHLDVAPGVGAD